MKNGIVIPCYNEANRLKLSEFKTFINRNPDYTLCFVNDGSKDETLNVLKNFQYELMLCNRGFETQVLVYDMPENGGKASAVRSGVRYLLDNTMVENIGFIDADLATGFDDYSNLVEVLTTQSLDAVIGSRKLDVDVEMERSTFRKAASYVFGKFINKIIGLDIKDTQCGAKVFSRSIAKEIFKNNFQSKWLFDVEILIRMKDFLGKKAASKFVKEISLKKWEEVDGSKITIKDSMQFPIQLCQIAIDYNLKPQLKNYTNSISTFIKPSLLS